MRQDEIARVEWRDFDPESKMLLIRDRKDPRKKKGNDQRIPLLDVSGSQQRCQTLQARILLYGIHLKSLLLKVVQHLLRVPQPLQSQFHILLGDDFPKGVELCGLLAFIP
jgi:hypothetical protein